MTAQLQSVEQLPRTISLERVCVKDLARVMVLASAELGDVPSAATDNVIALFDMTQGDYDCQQDRLWVSQQITYTRTGIKLRDGIDLESITAQHPNYLAIKALLSIATEQHTALTAKRQELFGR